MTAAASIGESFGSRISNSYNSQFLYHIVAYYDLVTISQPFGKLPRLRGWKENHGNKNVCIKHYPQTNTPLLPAGIWLSYNSLHLPSFYPAKLLTGLGA